MKAPGAHEPDAGDPAGADLGEQDEPGGAEGAGDGGSDGAVGGADGPPGHNQGPRFEEYTFTVVGDLLMHGPLLTAAQTDDGYDFTYLFAEVADELRRGDVTIANLETTLGGPERGFRGYPLFNTPDELLDAAIDSGIDTLITANNHAMDTGAAGLKRTLKVIRDRAPDLQAVGTRLEPDEPPFIILEMGGEEGASPFRAALLAYTYGTNGIPVPEPHLINLIDKDRMAADIAAAREAEPDLDLLMVAMHWGFEYHRQPSSEQKDLARYLHSLGVDAVLGTHPHVVQPFEVLTGPGPDGKPHSTAVIYSTGNFVSNQQWQYSDSGAVFHLTYRRTRDSGVAGSVSTSASADPGNNGTTRLHHVDYTPVWVHKFSRGGRVLYRALPLWVREEAPEAVPVSAWTGGRRPETAAAPAMYAEAKDDDLLEPWAVRRMEEVHNEMVEILGPAPVYRALPVQIWRRLPGEAPYDDGQPGILVAS